VNDSNKPLDSALDLLVFVPVGLAVTAAEELPKLAAKGRRRVEQQIAVARVVGQFAVSKGRVEIGRRLTSSPIRFPGGRAPAGEPPASDTGGAPDVPTSGVGDPLPDSDSDAEVTATVSDVRHTPAGEDASAAAPDTQPVEADGGPGTRKDPGSESDSRPAPEPAPDGDITPAAGSSPGTASSSDGGPASAPGTGAVTDPVLTPAGGETAPAEAPSAENLAIPGYDSLSASQVVQRLGGLSEAELAAVGAYEAAHRARQTVLTRVSQLQVDRD
jgi:hypothetical protein